YWTEADNYVYTDGEWEYVDSTPTGQRGWVKPRRTYKALEFQVDRAWDGKWMLNGSYTLSSTEGNAERPVNTDTNFGDTGRTENFDDPFVNLDGYGPLANDHRHQIKLRGTYAVTDNWRVGATVDAKSGGPITAFGVGNPYNWKSYHSYYLCVENCTRPTDAEEGDTWSTADRVFEHSPRGDAGRMPWTVDIGASVTYQRSFGLADFQAKLAVYNLLNDQKPIWVYQELEPDVGSRDSYFGQQRYLQSPRYAQLTLSLSYCASPPGRPAAAGRHLFARAAATWPVRPGGRAGDETVPSVVRTRAGVVMQCPRCRPVDHRYPRRHPCRLHARRALRRRHRHRAEGGPGQDGARRPRCGLLRDLCRAGPTHAGGLHRGDRTGGAQVLGH